MLNQLTFQKWILGYTRRFWYLLAFSLFLALVAVSFDLLSPLPLKFLADYVFGSVPVPTYLADYDKSSLLVIVAIFYIAIALLRTLFGSLQAIIGRRMAQKIDQAVMMETFNAATAIPASHPARKSSGRYVYQITAQSQGLSGYLLSSYVSIAQSVISIAAVLYILTRIDFRMTLLTLATLIPLSLSVIFFGKILERKAADTETAHGAIYDFIAESLHKIRTIQAFAKEKVRADGLTRLITLRNKKANSQLFTDELFNFTSELVILTAIILVLIFGGRAALLGNLTFGDLLLFIAYMDNIFEPITTIVSTVGSIKEENAALKQVHTTIAAIPAQTLKSGTIDQTTINGAIDYENISYSINNELVLQDVSLSIAAGSKVAFVGPSGKGKTTLLNMLLRFRSPDKGWVKIDQKDVNDYQLTFLRESVALIDQEPELFAMSIRDNIMLAHPHRPNSLPDVMAASSIANASEFIDSLSGTYTTPVDSDKLSGGQKQRLAIARAYYKKAPIVLMDEPTSALDKKSSTIFINNVLQFFSNQTVLIVTHDLSLLEKMDAVYVVDGTSVTPIANYGGLAAYRQQLTE